MGVISREGKSPALSTPTYPGIVTIPCGGKLAHDVPPGTLNSILKQARLK
jgi:predicted RNA binding protein YcfA (HicA-like mRNA interferase family)